MGGDPSAFAVDYPAAGEIVRGKGYTNLVSGHDPDVVLAHLSGKVGEYEMPVLQFDTKERVGQRFFDDAFNFDGFFFGHNSPVI